MKGLLLWLCGIGTTTKPFLRLIDGSDKLVITDGLQEEIKGGDFVALEGIFLKGGGEDNLGVGGEHMGEFHTIKVGHLDIEEQQVGLVLHDGIDGLDRVGERAE